MSIGTVELDLSMVNPDTGEYLTARTYTVDGVLGADGLPRQLSIGQLVMAICLQRATALEAEIVRLMESMNQTSARLESLTDIETQIVNYFSGENAADTWDLTTHTVATGAYAGQTVQAALTAEGVITNADVVCKDNVTTHSRPYVFYSTFVTNIESKMDENNSFSQQKMIELQSQTSKRDQTYDMISNVLKSLNTVLVGVANNI